MCSIVNPVPVTLNVMDVPPFMSEKGGTGIQYVRIKISRLSEEPKKDDR
jgi:hypothetical protein